MGSQLMYGDGVEDIKEFFSDALRGGRGREGGAGCCTRPVVVGSLTLIWLACLSISLIVLASRCSSTGRMSQS